MDPELLLPPPPPPAILHKQNMQQIAKFGMRGENKVVIYPGSKAPKLSQYSDINPHSSAILSLFPTLRGKFTNAQKPAGLVGGGNRFPGGGARAVLA